MWMNQSWCIMYLNGSEAWCIAPWMFTVFTGASSHAFELLFCEGKAVSIAHLQHSCSDVHSCVASAYKTKTTKHHTCQFEFEWRVKQGTGCTWTRRAPSVIYAVKTDICEANLDFHESSISKMQKILGLLESSPGERWCSSAYILAKYISSARKLSWTLSVTPRWHYTNGSWGTFYDPA